MVVVAESGMAVVAAVAAAVVEMMMQLKTKKKTMVFVIKFDVGVSFGVEIAPAPQAGGACNKWSIDLVLSGSWFQEEKMTFD